MAYYAFIVWRAFTWQFIQNVCSDLYLYTAEQSILLQSQMCITFCLSRIGVRPFHVALITILVDCIRIKYVQTKGVLGSTKQSRLKRKRNKCRLKVYH